VPVESLPQLTPSLHWSDRYYVGVCGTVFTLPHVLTYNVGFVFCDTEVATTVHFRTIARSAPALTMNCLSPSNFADLRPPVGV